MCLFKMAASAEREDHTEDPIVTPSKKTSVAWKYFGYRKSHRDKKNVLCKLCEKPVVHAGGTTNLKNHLFIWHRSVRVWIVCISLFSCL